MGDLHVALHVLLGEESLSAGLTLPHPQLFTMTFSHVAQVGFLHPQTYI
jgi:hypothetical protein